MLKLINKIDSKQFNIRRSSGGRSSSDKSKTHEFEYNLSTQKMKWGICPYEMTPSIYIKLIFSHSTKIAKRQPNYITFRNLCTVML